MSELRKWLSKNKLEQIAELFEANDIDFDVLQELSEADLEKLGLSLGSRKRLLRALAERLGAPDKSRSLDSDAPAGAVQNKVADSASAEKMSLTALLGHACGRNFKAAEHLAKHRLA